MTMLASAQVRVDRAPPDAIGLELAIARRIQQGFFPTALPRLEGVRMAGACRAAQEVGGDFYDIVPLPGGRVAWAIGDVSGKSIAAALYMAVARTALRMALGHGSSPAQCLAEVNARIVEDVSDGSFITCFLGIYDPATACLTYASAGHHLCLLVQGQAASGLGARGLPLGLAPEAFGPALDERQLRLRPGDRLALFTDGVVEAQCPDAREFGEERLLEALGGVPIGSAEDAVESALEAIAHHVRGATPFDDMTLVVADVLPSA